MFSCSSCKDELKKTVDAKMALLCKTFSYHNKNGYRCNDCERFIPHPLTKTDSVSCPYFDCCFVGNYSSLKKMNHPTRKSKIYKELFVSKVEIKEDINVSFLKDIIESEINNVIYSSSQFTIVPKTACYQAYLNLIDKFPDEMVNYLLNDSRSGGFQNKIFQEYVSILENSIPYSFIKNGKFHKVESLLDPELNFFEGISVFDEKVSDSLEIKNGTKEFYIGGRKASYTKPYYIGKLLNITDENSNSLLNDVSSYGFSKIKMKNVAQNTKVKVTHLRVVPHYQMGAMLYVNRMRIKILENVKGQNGY